MERSWCEWRASHNERGMRADMVERQRLKGDEGGDGSGSHDV